MELQREAGDKSHNCTYCSMLQPVVVYNFSELKITFQCYSKIMLPAANTSVVWFLFV